MDILLDKRAVRQIRLSAADAVEDGDLDTLREDIMDAFSEEQVEEIERRIDSGDFYDFLSETLDEWSGDDIDELFELIETHLSEVSVTLKYGAVSLDDDDDGDEILDDEDDDDESDDDDEVDLIEPDDEL